MQTILFNAKVMITILSFQFLLENHSQYRYSMSLQVYLASCITKILNGFCWVTPALDCSISLSYSWFLVVYICFPAESPHFPQINIGYVALNTALAAACSRAGAITANLTLSAPTS